MENSNDTIGNLIPNFSACSAVLQPVPPHAPISSFATLKLLYEYSNAFSK